MDDYKMYRNFAFGILKRLCERVNGKIEYKIYVDLDAIIFNITFKDFKFDYAIKDVTNLVLTGDTDTPVEDLLSKYRNVVLGAFFKSKNYTKRGEQNYV